MAITPTPSSSISQLYLSINSINSSIPLLYLLLHPTLPNTVFQLPSPSPLTFLYSISPPFTSFPNNNNNNQHLHQPFFFSLHFIIFFSLLHLRKSIRFPHPGKYIYFSPSGHIHIFFKSVLLVLFLTYSLSFYPSPLLSSRLVGQKHQQHIYIIFSLFLFFFTVISMFFVSIFPASLILPSRS